MTLEEFCSTHYFCLITWIQEWFSKEFIAFSCHGKKTWKALKDLRIEYYEANEYDLTHLTLERIQVFQKEIHFGSIMWLFPLRDGVFSIIGQ